jgi:hypothetical protein
MMKKSLMIATFLVVGGGAVGVSAGAPNPFKGSDTLFDLTRALLVACPGTAPVTYAGGGSGGGQTAMLAGTQQISPMSRFLNNGACTGTAAAPTLSNGLVIGLDGVSVVGSKRSTTHVACNGDPNLTCDPTFEPASGAAYNTAPVGAPGGYAFQGWRDVLRVLFAGFDHNAGSAFANRDCNSPIRVFLANNYGAFFENNCTAPAGDATAPAACTVIRHVFRRDDFSGTSDTVVGLLNLPSITAPETSVTTPNFTGLQHTGATPFCNAVRPGFALPLLALPTCLQGSDATWDPTEIATSAAGCAGQTLVGKQTAAQGRETAVYRSTMQDNDPIRRTCFGNAAGPTGTTSEDVCSHSGSLGLVLPMNDIAEAGDNTAVCPASSDPLRYNATQCIRASNQLTTGPIPQVYDAFTQKLVTCTTNGQVVCPNGDACTFGGCVLTSDGSATKNPQCLTGKTNTPAAGFANGALSLPVVDGKVPALNDGRSYNQHLYKQVAGVNSYQVGLLTGLNMTGAYYRIHTNHTLNPVNPRTCQFPDMTDQIGCLVEASPCSIGYAGRGSVDHSPGVCDKNPNSDPIKINQQNPETLCIQGDGVNVAGFTYPLSRKLYLSSVPGFAAVTAQELQLAACETDLAQPAFATPTPAGLMNANISNFGFLPIGSAVNGGEPYCEDFNENMLCAASVATANNNACGTAPANFNAFPAFNTVCGDGVQDPYEDCDCGTTLQPISATLPTVAIATANLAKCGATINGGTVCSTTCRNNQ